MAQARRQAAVNYYESLLNEVRPIYERGRQELAKLRQE